MKKNLLLISAAIIFKDQTNGRRWLIVKQNGDNGWEIPKVVVRKVESSVRALFRTMGEQGGMTIKVLEEAGRAGGLTTVNGKTVSQRHIYYLVMFQQAQGEMIGFEDHKWLEYAKAVRKLSTKRERAMLKAAKKELQIWLKAQKALQQQQ